MEYLIKRLGSQEMGSIDKHPKPQRGKYILVHRSEGILSYFPPLQKTQKNDFLLLPIIPLQQKKMSKVYCKYVYHNDKYHGSTVKSPRDEFRLYLNKKLENEKMVFWPNDIIVFRKGYLNTIDDEGESIKQLVYFLFYVKEGTPEYKEINELLQKSTYLLFNGEFNFIESKIKLIMDTPERDFIALIDESVKKEVEKRSEGLENLFNASLFRDFVLEGYNRVCAVTGISIKYENFLNIEAAHIKPKSHAGTYKPNNGIALSRDIHWAFDKGFFTINNDYTIKVHPEVESHFLRFYDKKKIQLPENEFFKPDKYSLEYHRNNIYGLFKQTGRL